MPFESKAQQRFMFSQHPRIAKRWANETKDIKGLPEKLHPEDTVKKTASEGLFFEKRARSNKGRFFRDLPGREDGSFHKQSMMGPGSYGGGAMDVSPTGAPMTGAGFRGEGIGSLYGTGKGKKPKKEKAVKTAAAAPSDWDSDSSVPVGLHRPTRQQPGGLEAGGERFHAKESLPPETEYVGPRKGTTEGGKMARRASAGHQMGKHASAVPPRFLGTSFGKISADMSSKEEYLRRAEDIAGTQWNQAKSSAKKGFQQAGKKILEGVDTATKSPAAMAGLAGLGGLLALKGAGRGVRGVANMFRRKPPSAPAGALNKVKKWALG